ncbi:ArsR/SmtB family transcription factor [Frankia sp. AgKG'84/4]|uniref:ArsR/SmtB family transcription factor n=1 Tax=Frankia sp. AgKG'84/4 TaxID=573490 RepID=UPI002010A848|nr:ArsR family transcriptional regulator [Frankia sp. AgKG'84/4]MCL9792812.1 ArsR family transcriptional regulator [Frankia sp. AgKG'84/4]
MTTPEPSGDELVQVMATLANPHRLRVLAALATDRNYVSRLARDLGIGRGLLQVHLRRLEATGLVSATLEISLDGKAMKFYEVEPFDLRLTPGTIAIAARTISPNKKGERE